jgi:hypothetical protein
MRPTAVCSSDGAAPSLRYLFFFENGLAHMTTSEPFTPRTPNPDKAPRPPTHEQPPAEKPGRPILLPSKPKATFQWPPHCLWPFTRTPKNDEWDSNA